ncbi:MULTISPECIES: ubiquitin-like domain-containing protein [unclassified Streptomyces]|uniref:ubiquitin-like domain-containing protein n=1 Tax=unclassified Streptomyces TaxID=2593676 RepID=UPI002E2F1EBD|nr:MULTISPECIES: ubiquitin-like domain-containing protein [unclassified Streptomyces]WUC68744.1 ubiquitin-like domain-containing protein [Streptomyces sp. NBC_00539]
MRGEEPYGGHRDGPYGDQGGGRGRGDGRADAGAGGPYADHRRAPLDGPYEAPYDSPLRDLLAPRGEPGHPAPPEADPAVPAPRPARRRNGRGRTAAPHEDPYRTPAEEPPGPGRRRRPEGGGPATVWPPAETGPGRRRRSENPPPAPAPAGTGRRRAAPAAAPPPATAVAAAAPGPDHWRRIVPQALVVAFLAGGTTAFVAADKTVRLTVDGVPRTLHTFADGVDELLAAEHLGVGSHDLVAPGRDTALEDGEEVVVRYGRPLHLTLDGTSRQVWTTSRTVEGALRQLGIRAEGAYLSAAPAAAVPRAGLALTVRTERGVTFMADGHETTIRTNAATVQEALGQAGITLRGQDTTSVAPESFPRDGQTVTVLRITGTREVREERIPFETERAEDDSLFAGTELVERAGRPGTRRVTYSLRTVNGVQEKPRRLSDEVIREPVTQLVKVGTKPLPASVAGADDLDWDALAQCESGGRPSATDASGTYGGLYQFDVTTWQSLGGSGRPQDASGAEQTYRAKKLYVQRGATPWPHCGRRLYR